MIPGRKNTGKECIIPERIKDIITEPAGNGKEKSDKDIIKSGKIKKIKDDLKNYEEFGFVAFGDVIRSTTSRESIKFYKDSELGFLNKNKSNKDNDNNEK